MNTLFYPEFNRLEIASRPLTSLATGEVLVRVAACGLCGSELETFKNRSARPARRAIAKSGKQVMRATHD